MWRKDEVLEGAAIGCDRCAEVERESGAGEWVVGSGRCGDVHGVNEAANHGGRCQTGTFGSTRVAEIPHVCSCIRGPTKLCLSDRTLQGGVRTIARTELGVLVPNRG